jgi:ABC-type glycerol-3-phosphate transport system permease component
MFKQKLDLMISYPVHFSGFVALYGLLIFLPLIRPPVLLTFVLVTLLVWLSMFYGRVLASQNPPESQPPAA